MARSKVIIMGAGGFAREVAHLCETLDVQVVGFLDERPEYKGRIVNGIEILGALTDVGALRSEAQIIVAGVGDPPLKARFAKAATEAGFTIASTLIHPSVRISKTNYIGVGGIICEGTILTVNIKIGDFVILNLACTVGHDAIIEDFVTVSPGVNISGNVTIGTSAYIGTGSAIIEKVTIGAGSIIAGGAFVRENVSGNTLVAGVPAVVKKTW